MTHISSLSQEVECAYVVMVMAIYWMTAVIPMGITGLLPVIMFPMFGLVSVPDVATNYIKNVQLVLMGSMFVAIAIEQQNFHRRLALKSLLAIGTSPRRLLFGIMFISWFLSFWLPNVAVTAMMVPIVEALVRELVTAAKDRNKPPVTEV
ncbi:hypothetical protein CAPTEDRAFT_121548 [Capitella teleta]|uniref:Citrate transporter-like domain-containing protein n=1 Tax=Capitella teleta TaxID=283909 RepID=R7V8D3_CAPTE|nr:hypothetical protein CAPTEDRAFT_121548 [Capitella teleta]|eukprot:ELU14804.1 hypothetical protein CAPTEDRAFT_121548 [Capitella teleta]